MNMLSRIYTWMMRVLLFATLVVPLIASSKHYYLYTFPKAMWFEACIALLLVIMGATAVWGAITKQVWWTRAMERIKTATRNPLFWLLVAMVIGMAISAVMATDSAHAWWGDPERAEGVVVHLLYIVFVLALLLHFDEKEWKWYGWGMLGVGVIAMIYQWMQLAGATTPFFHLSQQNRPGSLLGSPTYMGSYLILLYAVMGIGMVQQWYKANWQKWIIIVVAFATTVSLFLTQTRGAILGLAVGMVVMLLCWIVSGKKEIIRHISVRKIATTLLIAGAVVATLFFTTRTLPFWKQIPGVGRFAEESLISDTTAQTRIISAQVSLKALADKPLFGWGGENFLIAFNAHYDPEYFVYEQGWFDRAHNKVLGTAVMYGGVGLLVYLAWWGYMLWTARKMAWSHSGKQFFGWTILVGTLVAYFVQNLFAFDIMSSYLVLFSVAGFIIYTQTQHQHITPLAHPLYARVASILGGLLMVGVGVVVAYWLVGVPYVQSRAYINAIGQDSKVLGQEASTFLYPFSYAQPSLRTDFMQSVKNSGGATDTRLYALSNLAQEALEESAAHSQDPRPYQLLAEFYIQRGGVDKQVYTTAEMFADKGLAYAPKRQSLRYLKAAALSGQRKNDEALALLQETIDQAPDVAQSYYYYGSVLAVADGSQYSTVKEYLQKAKDMGMKFAEKDYDNYMKLYFAFRDWQALADITQEASGKYPTLEKYHKGAIVGFRGIRDARGVIEHAQALQELTDDPKAQQELDLMIRAAQAERWDILDQF
jgi:O-antigen ligase